LKPVVLNAIIAAAAGLLASCSDWTSSSDVKNADLALTLAQGEARYGKPIDRSELLALPGLESALDQRGRQVKASAGQQLRDPTDPIWGEVWTPDLVTICGTVNGRNAYGAYAGSEVFYSTDGETAHLAGSPQFKASEAQACQNRTDPRLILRGDNPQR
jgi:hypothetical protein